MAWVVAVRPEEARSAASDARASDERLRRLVGGLDEADLALQAGEGQHALLLEGGRELLGGHAVDLVAAVGDEVEDEAHLAQLLGEALHLVVAHSGRVPVEGRRQVVGQHLVREHGVDRIGELAGVVEVRRLGFHPQEVGEGRRAERLRDGVGNAAADLVVALRGLRVLAVPDDLDAERPGLLLGRPQRGALGEAPPQRGAHLERLALAGSELEHLGHRLAVGLEAGLLLPGLEKARCDGVERVVGGEALLLVAGGVLRGQGGESLALEPALGDPVLLVAERVEQVAVELADPEIVEALQETPGSRPCRTAG